MSLARGGRAIGLALALSAAGTAAAEKAATPQHVFFDGLQSLCGKAYEGRIVTNTPTPSTPDPFEGQRLVMHVRECAQDAVAIPFHVGTDRSRTWLVSRHGDTLRLKHRHLHADGTPDAVSMYGGNTADAGSAHLQRFPADADSRAMFEREGLKASVDNTWSLEHLPGQAFRYGLHRPGREFLVEFDLTRPVPPPIVGDPG